MTEPTRITVAGEPAYDVVVGERVLGQLGALVGSAAEQVLVVHPGSLSDLAADVERQLLADGKAVVLAAVPDGGGRQDARRRRGPVVAARPACLHPQ